MLAVLLLGGSRPAFGAGLKQLHGHVPAVVGHLTALGELPATNQLHLAIGVALRDPAGLGQFLAGLYDPANPGYRQFLTPAEFTARFGPSEADYAAVKEFALTNGFTITAEHDNRLLLDVTARVPDVERAFHIRLRIYQHPAEPRVFYAPDTEPTVGAALPVADVEGLSDYSKPRPRFKKMERHSIAPRNGSAPDGVSFIGNDFRNAYVPGTTLTGAGQMAGVLEFDGYYTSDIETYAATAGNGRTNIVIQPVLLDGFNGIPYDPNANGEVSLDIEMVMAMAPGLAKIIVFEGNPTNSFQNDILNAMAASNTVKSLSCCWSWPGGPTNTTDAIFQKMMAQGQSFFNASGDSDAFAAGSASDVDNPDQFNAPDSCPYITQVGGTLLTMNGAGTSYASEVVWNDRYTNSTDGGNWGGSGGLSTYYPIPGWQMNLNLAASGGSTTMRNIPDVALVAAGVFTYLDDGQNQVTEGTSCATPLWSGLMCLVNQQAVAAGKSAIGFINPAIYEIASESIYNSAFNDITNGDNAWAPSSPGLFYAGPGYDLCTGLGTPAGTNLINALASPDPLVVSTNHGFATSGRKGGPFSVASQTFLLTNTSSASLTWSVINTSAWLNVSSTGGTLAKAASATNLASLNAAASNLVAGTYDASIEFTNTTSHVGHARLFTLQVTDPLVLLTTNGFSAYGAAGGPFNPNSQIISFTNLNSSAGAWDIINTAAWLNVSSTSGVIPGNSRVSVTASPAPGAAGLTGGIYNASLVLSNMASLATWSIPFQLLVSQSVVQNGGFATGNFGPWTLVDDGSGNDFIDNGSYAIPPYTGTYDFVLGDTNSPAYFSQILPTVPGQDYLLSFWLYQTELDGGGAQIFDVNWNTNAASMNTIYTLPVQGAFNWSEFNFVVAAASTNTTLQFAAQNVPAYFGLDDVSVTPIPVPTLIALGLKTNAFTFTWNSLAGISYAVQYKTNLLASGWTNLSTNTATTYTTSFTDTPGANLARFYRVSRLSLP
jgi:hypothetical protein